MPPRVWVALSRKAHRRATGRAAQLNLPRRRREWRGGGFRVCHQACAQFALALDLDGAHGLQGDGRGSRQHPRGALAELNAVWRRVAAHARRQHHRVAKEAVEAPREARHGAHHRPGVQACLEHKLAAAAGRRSQRHQRLRRSPGFDPAQAQMAADDSPRPRARAGSGRAREGAEYAERARGPSLGMRWGRRAAFGDGHFRLYTQRAMLVVARVVRARRCTIRGTSVHAVPPGGDVRTCPSPTRISASARYRSARSTGCSSAFSPSLMVGLVTT